MAFGRLTTKWRIFRSDLNCATAKNCQIIRVGIKLHNYVINADNLNLCRYESDNFNDLGVEPLENGPAGNRGYLPNINAPATANYRSNRRDDILSLIQEREIVRPEHNIVRNGLKIRCKLVSLHSSPRNLEL